MKLLNALHDREEFDTWLQYIEEDGITDDYNKDVYRGVKHHIYDHASNNYIAMCYGALLHFYIENGEALIIHQVYDNCGYGMTERCEDLVKAILEIAEFANSIGVKHMYSTAWNDQQKDDLLAAGFCSFEKYHGYPKYIEYPQHPCDIDGEIPFFSHRVHSNDLKMAAQVKDLI